ncbi:MAG: dockerin type I repeat-containing protein [Candidatus Zixiibacteriota bacterium]
MVKKVMLVSFGVILALAVMLMAATNDRPEAFRIEDADMAQAPSSRAACPMTKTSGTAASYWGNYEAGEQTITYFNPEEFCAPPVYPFEITAFSFTLYDFGGTVWPALVDIVVYDVAPSGDSCDGPGTELCRYSVSADQATFMYPTVGTFNFPAGGCCINGPFFIGLEYTSGAAGSTPSILFDNNPAPDTCDNWNMYYDGLWYEWYDFWTQPGPGYPLYWVDGETNSSNCVQPLVIFPGVDLFETPNDSMTVESLFTSNPIPPDFFGPGSDPFVGIIAMEGSPLATLPPDTLGPTDVIIKRLEPAVLDDPPSADTVPIQLIALSLRSTEPITVTYNGGQDPELWGVEVCLSTAGWPPLGSMVITRECDSGGSFTAAFYEVLLKATFTRIDPPGELVLDPYRVDGIRTIPDGRWATYVPIPFSVYTVVDWVEVDTDCDGSPEYSIAPDTSSFYPGITLEPCPPGPPICGGKVLTLLDAVDIDHRMLPPQRTSPPVGACCLPDSSCILTDLTCCDALIGTYKGDYTSCFPDPCVSCCNTDGIRGDVDMSGSLNVADVTYLVAYLKGLGPAPTCDDEADVDGSGTINVADVTYLVAYLKGLGPAPPACP